MNTNQPVTSHHLFSFFKNPKNPSQRQKFNSFLPLSFPLPRPSALFKRKKKPKKNQTLATSLLHLLRSLLMCQYILGYPSRFYYFVSPPPSGLSSPPVYSEYLGGAESEPKQISLGCSFVRSFTCSVSQFARPLGRSGFSTLI